MLDFVGINDHFNAPQHPEHRLVNMANRTRGWRGNTSTSVTAGAGDFYTLGRYELTWLGTGDMTLIVASGMGNLITSLPNYKLYDITGHSQFSLSYSGPKPSGIVLESLDTPQHVRQLGPVLSSGLFSEGFIDDVGRFHIWRTMDLSRTNGISLGVPNDISGWDERPHLDDEIGTWFTGGWPWEMQFAAGVHANRDLWINIPHRATDNYVKELSLLANQYFNSGSYLYIEYSNEVWNGQFGQQAYVRNVLGDTTTTGRDFAYGKRCAEIWNVFNLHATGTLPRYVLAGQSTVPRVIRDALKGVDSVPGGSGLLDVISSNAYFNPGQEDLYASGYLPSGANIDMALDFCRTSINNRIQPWKEYSFEATQRGVPYIAYEGGQHIVASAGVERSDSGYVDFLADVNRSTGIKAVYNELAEIWRGLSGQGIVYFQRLAPWNEFGSWGHQEYVGDNSPKNSGLNEHIQDQYETTGLILSLPNGGNPSILNWRGKPASVYDGTNTLNITLPEPINPPFTVQFAFRRHGTGIGGQPIGICEALGFESPTDARASCDVGEPTQFAVRSRHGDRGDDNQILFLQNGSSPANGPGPKWHPHYWHHATMIFDGYNPDRQLFAYLDDDGRSIQAPLKRDHVRGDFTGIIIGNSNNNNHRLDLCNIIITSGIKSVTEINAHSSGLGLNFNDSTSVIRQDNRGPNETGIWFNIL